ncbi:MAG: tRNA epoxyqueuosine(34) reductase QueG [Bdellovibrionales bacterium]|nr:tRNA epoxyqueuosine(34) reductase QueG [Bdellovibrionales bacterium]
MSKTSISLIHHLIKGFPFEQYGFAALEKPYSLNQYKNWLEKNFHGTMKYLETHLEEKEFPQRLQTRAHSAIVVTRNYYPFPKDSKNNLFPNLQIALYAKGEDYHHWLMQELNQLCKILKQHFPEEEFIPFVDSAPVLERDLAYRAGLGWIGKNSCLIHSKIGSLFFIAEIYTSLNLTSFTSPHPDRCGTCTRCIDACPTQAIQSDRTLDARRCISYLTIESKDIPEDELKPLMGKWFYGCDICQTVCPWNLKHHSLESPTFDRQSLILELTQILSSSNKKLMLQLKNSPLNRARGFGLKRNALLVIQNIPLFELKHEVEKLVNDDRLGALATDVLQTLNSQTSS